MAVLEIPVTNESDNYSFTVAINDTDYLFDVVYNTRSNHWFLSISTIEGEALASSIPIVTDTPLLSRWEGVSGLPQDGFLMAVDTSGESRDPVKEDFGDVVRLLWVPLDDI